MPYSHTQKLGHATQPGGAGDDHSQTNSSTPGKTVCPYEEHVVTDPNVSRIVLMIMRDFVNRKALYDYAEDERTKFPCPIMRCYKEFDQPMGLIGHLLECEKLKFGEFNCLRCKNCHRYPITEREWLVWEGWQAEVPPIGIKKRLSGLSDSIFRAIRSQRRSNAPSSHGGSPSAAAKSPGPPDWVWSETEHPTLHDKANLRPLPNRVVAPCELQGASSIELPDTPPPCYPQSSSGSFMSGQNSNSRSGSSMFDMPGAFWDSSASSIGSSQVTAPQLQIPIHTSPMQYMGNLTQSPEGMSLDQAGGQPVWEPTPTPSYASEAASRTIAFVPTPDSQGTAADYFPISTINEFPGSNVINTWDPHDSSLYSWLQGQMSPPPPPPPPPQGQHSGLVHMLRDIPAAHVGVVDRYPQVPHELPGQVAIHELDCGGRASDHTCEICGWQPKETGKQENFANYLRKHKQTHSGRKFYCRNVGCERSYSRPDNLSKHIKESHPGGIGAHGSPSCQARSANKRRFTNSSMM